MDGVSEARPERTALVNRAARRSLRLAQLALWAALLWLGVPPLVHLAADVWLLAWTSGEQREDAQAILMRSVSAGAARRAEAKWLLSRSGAVAGPGTGPVVMPSPPPPDHARAIPMCADSQSRGTDGRERPSHAYAAVSDAEFRLAVHRLGAARLVALDACFNASSFGALCQRVWREAGRSDRAQIEAEVVRSGAAGRANGRVCWCRSGPCSWEEGSRGPAERPRPD